MMDNPYAPPAEATAPGLMAPSEVQDRSLQTLARATFLAWEKLRIAYNAVLIVVTVPALAATQQLDLGGLGVTLRGAIVANLLYFAGPTIETYVRWLGYDRTWPRWLLFLGGTALASLLAVGAIAARRMQDLN